MEFGLSGKGGGHGTALLSPQPHPPSVSPNVTLSPPSSVRGQIFMTAGPAGWGAAPIQSHDSLLNLCSGTFTPTCTPGNASDKTSSQHPSLSSAALHARRHNTVTTVCQQPPGAQAAAGAHGSPNRAPQVIQGQHKGCREGLGGLTVGTGVAVGQCRQAGAAPHLVMNPISEHPATGSAAFPARSHQEARMFACSCYSSSPAQGTASQETTEMRRGAVTYLSPELPPSTAHPQHGRAF